jgi:hypothetical protein
VTEPEDRWPAGELEPHRGRPVRRPLRAVNPYDGEAYGLDPDALPVLLPRGYGPPRQLPDARTIAAGSVAYSWSGRPLRADAPASWRAVAGAVALGARLLVLLLVSLLAVIVLVRLIGWAL